MTDYDDRTLEEFKQTKQTFHDGMSDDAISHSKRCPACESRVRPVVSDYEEPACPVCGALFLEDSDR